MRQYPEDEVYEGSLLIVDSQRAPHLSQTPPTLHLSMHSARLIVITNILHYQALTPTNKIKKVPKHFESGFGVEIICYSRGNLDLHRIK